MKITTRIVGTALALAFTSALATAQDKPKAAQKPKTTADKTNAAPAGADAEKAAMEAMMKAATPGEPHKTLASMEGTFDTTIKMWMKPGDPPQETKGTTERKMVLGGRYLSETFEGTFMDQPFSGMGMTGYDNVTKRYVGTWSDTMSTGMMTSTGTMDKGGKSITLKATAADPETGKMVSFKEKMTMTDPDHQTFEMWGPAKDGKVYKMMEIAYSRKK